ncbi:MAG: cation diffusion facilitator family transporter [Kitasatospora sp.]|nr:cation diffusion facilitator family transporter [Kitasatospora sp.]
MLAALAANLGIAVTKLIAFLITGSASLLAETVHSVADSGNEVLLLVGRRRSGRRETRLHPFGFGRERYFYGFIVAVMLFAVGGIYSVYDGVRKIIHPEQLTTPAVAFAVLGVAIVLEAFSLRTAVSRSNDVRGRLGWTAFIRRSKAPELPVVLLEDTAALTGLVFALIGVTLAVVTGDGAWDGAGSLAIGVLLCCVAGVLAVEMKSLLIGESASAEAERAIVAALESGPEIDCVIHLRTVHIGPESLLVGAKIAFRRNLTTAEISAAINSAERRVREAVPIAEVIYLEPDLYRPALDDASDPAVRAARLTDEQP